MLPGLLMIVIGCAVAYAKPEPAAPFWKAKEKVFARVQNGEIIVAVKSEEVKEPGKMKNRMTVHGGGHVAAPATFVFAKALEFDQLGKVSGYIKSAKFDKATGMLDLAVGALGFDGKMKLHMKIRDEAVPKEIEFLVAGGAMQGLTGTFTFSDLGPKKTEVGIACEFNFDKFPAPKVFLEFGLEVVFQRMAARLRSYVEDEFKKNAAGT